MAASRKLLLACLLVARLCAQSVQDAAGQAWTLVAQQDIDQCTFSAASSNSFTENLGNASAACYMSVGNQALAPFQQPDGSYVFKIVWTLRSPVTLAPSVSTTTYEVIWQQTSWLTAQSITGYVPLNPGAKNAQNSFQGLGASASSVCLLDGNGAASGWWNCIGQQIPQNIDYAGASSGTLPGILGPQGTNLAKASALHVLQPAWTLLAQQDITQCTFAANASASFLQSKSNASAPCFMNVGSQDPGSLVQQGAYFMKIGWTVQKVVPGYTSNFFEATWRQTSWLTSGSITDFQALNYGAQAAAWCAGCNSCTSFQGLGASDQKDSCVLDGNGAAGCWWNCIGQKVATYHGAAQMPGPMGPSNYATASVLSILKPVWVLLAKQDIRKCYFQNANVPSSVYLENPTNTSAPCHMNIGLQDPNVFLQSGKYVFRILWTLSTADSRAGNTNTLEVIWQQVTWLTTPSISGFQPLNEGAKVAASANFMGLAPTDCTTSTVLDGCNIANGASSCWWNNIGQKVPQYSSNTGMPGPFSSNLALTSALYVQLPLATVSAVTSTTTTTTTLTTETGTTTTTSSSSSTSTSSSSSSTRTSRSSTSTTSSSSTFSSTSSTASTSTTTFTSTTSTSTTSTSDTSSSTSSTTTRSSSTSTTSPTSTTTSTRTTSSSSTSSSTSSRSTSSSTTSTTSTSATSTSTFTSTTSSSSTSSSTSSATSTSSFTITWTSTSTTTTTSSSSSTTTSTTVTVTGSSTTVTNTTTGTPTSTTTTITSTRSSTTSTTTTTTTPTTTTSTSSTSSSTSTATSSTTSTSTTSSTSSTTATSSTVTQATNTSTVTTTSSTSTTAHSGSTSKTSTKTSSSTRTTTTVGVLGPTTSSTSTTAHSGSTSKTSTKTSSSTRTTTTVSVLGPTTSSTSTTAHSSSTSKTSTKTSSSTRTTTTVSVQEPVSLAALTEVVLSLPVLNSSTSLQPEAAQQLLGQVAAASTLVASETSTGSPLPLNVTLKIAAAVQDMERGLAQGLFSSNDTQAKATRVLTVSSGGIKITVAALPAMQPGEEGAIDPQSVPGVPLAEALPREAMQAAAQAVKIAGGSKYIGISSCRWTGFNPFGPASTADQAVQPAGDIISLSLTNAQGKPLPVNNLAKPIMLVIPISMVNLTQDSLEQMLIDGFFPECRWWNETRQQWAGEGCKSMGLRNGTELLCACTHLTTFGAFTSPIQALGLMMDDISDIAQFLWMILTGCANVATLWTPEGVAALGEGSWAHRGSAGFVFLLINFLALLLLPALCIDHRNKKELLEIWGKLEHVHWFDLKMALKESYTFIQTPSQWRKNYVKSVLTRLMAVKLGISQGTIEILEEARDKSPGYAPNLEEAKDRPKFSLAATVIKAACRMDLFREVVLEDFGISSRDDLTTWRWALLILRRALYLVGRAFVAVHPIMFLLLTDLYTLTHHRALLVAVQYLGAVFANAFWYQSAGMTLTTATPQECITTTLAERARKALPVALVSAFLSAGSAQVLYFLITARPRGEDQRSGTRQDAALSLVFHTAALGLCVWYLFYLCIFLANIHESSAELWIVSASQSLVCSLLLMPMAEALLSVVLALVSLNRDPALAQSMFDSGRLVEPQRKTSERKQPAESGEPQHRVIQVREAPAKQRPVFFGPLDEADNIVFNFQWPNVPDHVMPSQDFHSIHPRPALTLRSLLG